MLLSASAFLSRGDLVSSNRSVTTANFAGFSSRFSPAFLTYTRGCEGWSAAGCLVSNFRWWHHNVDSLLFISSFVTTLLVLPDFLFD